MVLGIDDGIEDDSLQSDGLLGLTASAYSNAELLVEALYDAGHISENAFGTDYRFRNETSWITIGGYDTSVVTNPDYLHWIDIEGSFHWEVPLTWVAYGGRLIEMEAEIGILDTGTSLSYWQIPNNDWANLYNEMTQGMSSCSTYIGLPGCACDSIYDFSDLTFNFDGIDITMPVESYVEEYTTGICVMYISGLDYSFSTPALLLGDSFLRNSYIYHDAANLRVAFYKEGETYDAGRRRDRRNLKNQSNKQNENNIDEAKSTYLGALCEWVRDVLGKF